MIRRPDNKEVSTSEFEMEKGKATSKPKGNVNNANYTPKLNFKSITS